MSFALIATSACSAVVPGRTISNGMLKILGITTGLQKSQCAFHHVQYRDSPRCSTPPREPQNDMHHLENPALLAPHCFVGASLNYNESCCLGNGSGSQAEPCPAGTSRAGLASVTTLSCGTHRHT